VHVVQSCHLDIGFAGTSVAIINKYIGPEGYFESAPRLAAALRKRGGPESYSFLTQSWLVELYLNCDAHTFPHLPREGLRCPDQPRLAAFEAAVRRGDITWHAFPFDGQASVPCCPLLSRSSQLRGAGLTLPPSAASPSSSAASSCSGAWPTLRTRSICALASPRRPSSRSATCQALLARGDTAISTENDSSDSKISR
jgi:hypothetical protein